MILTIGPLGDVGVVTDVEKHLLPLNAWTEAMNVSFRDGKVVRTFGYRDSLTPSIDPIYAQYVPIASNAFWLYAGTAAVYASDGTSHADITRASGGAYAATADLNWTGGNLGGIPVINNGIDPPQAWLTPSLATPLVRLTNWPADTLCQSIRPFKNYLVALDITESVTRYPQMVRWSHPADPGAVPSSWDYTNPSVDAGRIELRETSDFLVDQAALRDVNVLYKDSSVWGMQFIGGTDIFRFFKMFDSIGLLTKRCAMEFNSGQHVVFTTDDCIVHDGQQAQSIIQKKIRRTLFNEINQNAIKRCFVSASWLTQEVYFCYPSGSATYCDKALVWNWKENTLSFRELPSIAHIAAGVVDFSGVVPASWDSDSESWDADSTAWDFSQVGARDRRMLWVKPSTRGLYGAPYGVAPTSGVLDSWVTREGIGFPLRGGGPPDFSNRKLLKRLWPQISGDAGTTIQVYIGGQDDIQGSTTWKGPFPYIIGTTKKIDCLVNARLHSFQFYCAENANWNLSAMDVELEPLGVI